MTGSENWIRIDVPAGTPVALAPGVRRRIAGGPAPGTGLGDRPGLGVSVDAGLGVAAGSTAGAGVTPRVGVGVGASRIAPVVGLPGAGDAVIGAR